MWMGLLALYFIYSYFLLLIYNLNFLNYPHLNELMLLKLNFNQVYYYLLIYTLI